MPKPKQPRKPPKLPDSGGIHQITLPAPGQASVEPSAAVEPVFSEEAVRASDRILLDQLKTALEARHGRPYSTGEVLRWALWHCPWDA